MQACPFDCICLSNSLPNAPARAALSPTVLYGDELMRFTANKWINANFRLFLVITERHSVLGEGKYTGWPR